MLGHADLLALPGLRRLLDGVAQLLLQLLLLLLRLLVVTMGILWVEVLDLISPDTKVLQVVVKRA